MLKCRKTIGPTIYLENHLCYTFDLLMNMDDDHKVFDILYPYSTMVAPVFRGPMWTFRLV